VKVSIEADRCEGYGMCTVHLPDVIKLDDLGYAYVEHEGAVPDGLEARAKHAILDCPVHAIHETDS
jgi:ferredoxin